MKIMDECAAKLKADDVPFILCAVTGGKDKDFKDTEIITDYYSIGERMALLIEVIRKYAYDVNLPMSLFASELLSFIIRMEHGDPAIYELFGDNRKVGSQNENN